MNTGRAIRKILFISLWVAIGGGMLTLLIAAIGKQKKDHCRDYVITVKSPHDNFFIDEKDVLKLLKTTVKGNIKGQPKSSLNLQQMEKMLEKNVWIKDAELYFDNRNVLHISVKEREPIARLFTGAGKSFYLDESGKMMPLSDKLPAKLPVFTGFPEKIISTRDSTLAANVKTTAELILNDPFWMAQVAQIDITPGRNFEMIPVVGNHTVLMGDGENIDRKFHRLFVFYKNVLSQAGFDKYKTINVQYAGEVIGVKEKQTARVDTSQLRLNVEKLLREAREVQNDSLITAKELKEQKEIKVDPGMSATERATSGVNTNDASVSTTSGAPQAQQGGSNSNPVLVTNPVPMKRLSDPKTGDRKPKAVMPRSSQ